MDFISILTYFGITPATITPLAVASVFSILCVFKHTKPIKESLQELREGFSVLEFRVDDLTKRFDDFKTDLSEVRSRTEDLKEGFFLIQSRMSDLWRDRLAPSKSPRQLNDKGLSILHNSGIKELIDESTSRLREIILSKKATNPYDTEKVIIETVMKLPDYFPNTIDRLKDAAFKSGTNIDGVLFVGAIYFRDTLLKELGLR